MPFAEHYRFYTLQMLLLVTLLAAAAWLVGQWPAVLQTGISPLVLGLFAGVLFGNLWGQQLPAQCTPGIVFCAKTVLRIAIVFYGFRITFGEIAEVGLAAFTVSLAMMVSTLWLGSWVGVRWFRLDRDTAMLNAAGAAVCGAAAVVAVESVLRSAPYKTAVAVATVVCFGTLAMIVLPLLHGSGWLALSAKGWGVYVGGTVHEVAQVVAVGHTLDDQAANDAVIVKMTRVLLLAPALLVLAWWLGRAMVGRHESRRKAAVPWFAVGFLLVVGVNSAAWLPQSWVKTVVDVDSLLLTMAMVALGIETRVAKIRQAGLRPIAHGAVLFVWLMGVGYGVTLLAMTPSVGG
jgi:uncharacterized integral membrane protein (TIGR00698 family)